MCIRDRELLRKTLRDVGDEASRTFLGPVTRRAARYIERILPGGNPEFNEEMSLTGIMRDGTAEASGDLSRGTQEQLAVLTRLAFADLLLEKGAPVSLILDDPLVYSDDGRFEAMTDILTEAASRMQVILFTCRAKAFRHVPGPVSYTHLEVYKRQPQQGLQPFFRRIAFEPAIGTGQR